MQSPLKSFDLSPSVTKTSFVTENVLFGDTQENGGQKRAARSFLQQMDQSFLSRAATKEQVSTHNSECLLHQRPVSKQTRCFTIMDPDRIHAYLQVACAALGFDIGEVWWTTNENGSSTLAAIGKLIPWSTSSVDFQEENVAFGLEKLFLRHSWIG